MFDSLFLLSARRYPALDGLRALATLMIFNVHFFAQYAGVDYFLVPGSLAHHLARTLHSGSLGVDILFLLSGCLTHYSALSRCGPGPLVFLGQRASRLLPVILAVNLPALCWGAGAVPFAQAFDNIFFLKLFPQSTFVNYITWALVYEMWFYLAYALVFLPLRRGPLFGSRAWLGLLFAAYALNVLLFRRLALFCDPRFAAFFAGLLLGSLLHDPARHALLDRAARLLWVPALAAIVAACWAWSTPYYLEVLSATPPARFGFHLGFACAVSVLLWRLLRPGGPSVAFSAGAARLVGVVSFSLFMTHTQWGLPLAGRLVGKAQSFAGVLAAWGASLGLCVLLATLVFLLLERPYFRKA